MPNIIRYGGGVVIPPSPYLYNLGDECTALTGGWDVNKKTSATNAVYEKRTSSIYLYTGTTGEFSPSEKMAYAQTTNSIDLTGFTTLKINVLNATVTSAAYARLYINTAKDTTSNASQEGATMIGILNGATGEKTIDISSLNGSFYIEAKVYASYSGPSYSATLEFDSIKLT